MPTGTALLLLGFVSQVFGLSALEPVRCGDRSPGGVALPLLALLLAHSFRLPLGHGWVNAGSLLLLILFFLYSDVFRPKLAALGIAILSGAVVLFGLAPFLAGSAPWTLAVAVALAVQTGNSEEAVLGGALAVWGTWSSLEAFQRFAWTDGPSPFAEALLGIWLTVLTRRWVGAALRYLSARTGRSVDAQP